MRYKSNSKHKEPWQRGRRGTLCPRDVDRTIAEQLLAGSDPEGGKRYAAHAGRAYCAQHDGHNVWHGYPVGWKEVPEKLRRKWLREGRMQRRDIRKHWQE